jgi:hypothetical protein
MLRAESEKQRKHVEQILESATACFAEPTSDGVRIEGEVTYDQLAELVDYLRTSDNKDDLFETCWVAYRRKGSKKKAREYWRKLTDAEKENVMAHIKAYVKSRDLCYQKDFERYLRDKTFNEIIIKGNNVVYDPTKLGKGESVSQVYMPSGNFSITWDDQLKAYLYIGFYSDGQAIADGYTDATRPDGARIVLNNGRGELVWSSITRTWIKQ